MHWMRLRRSGASGTPCGTGLPDEFRIRTAEDVLGLVAEQVLAVRESPNSTTIEKARTIGYLASVALRAVELANLSGRVDALERALKGKRNAKKTQ